jgi:hypothetical protein
MVEPLDYALLTPSLVLAWICGLLAWALLLWAIIAFI